MKTTNNSDESFLNFGKDYEAHLFDYVLRHVKQDRNLDPEIVEAISANLLQEEYFGKYYLKVKELYQQGLFDDSYTYADFLICQEDNAFDELGTEESEKPTGKQRGLIIHRSWINVAAVATILIVASVLTFQYVTKPDVNDDQLADATEVENIIKSLGNEKGNKNVLSFTADTEIQHNSELLADYSDPVFCKMHLVFKGISEKGFIVRSKRRGIGNEDPFKEELEVRFSNSRNRAAIIKALETSLKNREFPEYIVRGLYCKDIEGLNTYDALPLLTVHELVPVNE